MSPNSARPSSSYVSPDDPQLDIPQIEDPLAPFRHDPQARRIAEAGLLAKARRALECGMVFTFNCPEHRTRKRIPKQCRLRFCPECAAGNIKAAKERNADKLEVVRAMNHQIVLCEVRYLAPAPLDQVDTLKAWKLAVEEEFYAQWDAYVQRIPDMSRVPVLSITSCNGFELIDGHEYLVFHAFLGAESTDHKHVFRSIWPEAASVWVERGGKDMIDSWTDRTITPAKNATKGQRLAYHEIIFDGSRQMRVRSNSLFPIEQRAVGNNSLKDDPDSPHEHGHGPFAPFHCDICGKLCRVSLEKPWESLDTSPPN